jgi:hypothetical protein
MTFACTGGAGTGVEGCVKAFSGGISGLTGYQARFFYV